MRLPSLRSVFSLSSPSPSTALCPPTRLRPLDLDSGPTPSLVFLTPARPGVGEVAGVIVGADVVVVLAALLLVVLVEAVGALRPRLRLPLLLLALEVHPGHPSAPHGQGAS